MSSKGVTLETNKLLSVINIDAVSSSSACPMSEKLLTLKTRCFDKLKSEDVTVSLFKSEIGKGSVDETTCTLKPAISETPEVSVS